MKIVYLFLFSFCTNTFAGALYLKFGPASIGNGGSNPLGIPPRATDMEIEYVGDLDYFAGVPGIGIGKRFQKNWGGYVSAGGAFVINANGGGIGGYSAFGYEYGGSSFVGSFEYKQYLGVSSAGLLSPYSTRLGIGYRF